MRPVNTFNYAAPSWPLNISSNQVSATSIPSPFFNTDNLSQFYDPIPGPKDILPENGWELIKRDLGFNDQGVANNPGTTFPYFIVYNKYRSVLRIFFAKLDFNSFNGCNVILKFDAFSPMKTSVLDLSKEVKAVDVIFDTDKTFTTVAAFGSTLPFKWFYADFPLMYDPCTCLYASKLNMEVWFSNTSKVTLEGTSTGRIETIIDQGRPVNGSSDNSSYSVGKLTEGAKKATDSYKSAVGFINGFKTKVDKYAPQQEKQNKKDLADQLAQVVGKSGFLRAGLNSIPFISSAVSLFDFFTSGGTQASGPIDVNVMPMSIDMFTKLKGDIQNNTPYTTIGFRTPGSDVSGASDNDYPYYNEVLGTFNLMLSPKLTNLVTRTQEFDEVTFNIITRTQELYKIKEDLSYVLNPASGL